MAEAMTAIVEDNDNLELKGASSVPSITVMEVERTDKDNGDSAASTSNGQFQVDAKSEGQPESDPNSTSPPAPRPAGDTDTQLPVPTGNEVIKTNEVDASIQCTISEDVPWDPETEKSVAESVADSVKEDDPEPEMIAEVRKWDFEGFKSRTENVRYVIDALEAGPDILQEVRRLHHHRRVRDLKKYTDRRVSLVSQPSPQANVTKGKWLQRVRIQSPGVIYHLSKVVQEPWSPSCYRTFFRPFRVFIYFQPGMKEALQKLEDKWKGKVDSELREIELPAPNTDTTSNDMHDPTTEDYDFENEVTQNPEMYNLETLKAMRCYVKFVDEQILPLYKPFDETVRTKIRFEDLWLLFRVGELVFAGHSSDIYRSDGGRKHGRVKTKDFNLSQSTTVWRIYTLNCPNDFSGYPSFEMKSKPRRADSDDDTDDENSVGAPGSSFRVWAYYIDFDGDTYGPVKHSFSIPRFEGEVEIRSLPCYPIRFAEDGALLEKLGQEGSKFKECIEKSHVSYNGWTAASTPTGEQISYFSREDNSSMSLNQEFIESHVIVDFVEAIKDQASWKPEFHDPKVVPDANWVERQDKYMIEVYKSEEISFEDEVIQSNDGVNMWRRRENLEEDGFLKSYKGHLAPGKSKKPVELREEDLVLLPKTIFAYILRDRKFSVLDCRFMKSISPQQNVFDRLKIPKQYKSIVRGLVASHFMKKTLERKFSALSVTEKREFAQPHPQEKDASTTLSAVPTEGLSQDVIEGKGRGLVLLLHGVPGVGKTATAEAVALESKKPLFVITCGDLGLTPSEVESRLTEIFRLAHLWDCVLLLDEADVFLSSRSTLDLKRNALVSVFLRVLEYYSGILFLTTNRVGTLDEAFKSRIHISLYYEALGKAQAGEIFKINITRLKEIARTRSKIANEPELTIHERSILSFAAELFEQKKNPDWIPWNGRQIRNAFQIASALAYNEMHLDYIDKVDRVHKGELPKKFAQYTPPVLDDKHFRIVAKVTDDFDLYMKEAKGRNDFKMAGFHGERAEFFPASKDLGLSTISVPRGIETFGLGQETFGVPPETGEQSRGRLYQDPRSFEGPMSFGPGSQIDSGSPSRGDRFVTPSTRAEGGRGQGSLERHPRTPVSRSSQVFDNPAEHYMPNNYSGQGTRNSRRDSMSQDAAEEFGMSHQDFQPRSNYQNPPRSNRVPQGDDQFHQYDRRGSMSSYQTRMPANAIEPDPYRQSIRPNTKQRPASPRFSQFEDEDPDAFN